MTTTSHINGGAMAVWPEQTSDDDHHCEHAIVVVPYSGSIMLERNGNSIDIPLYALPHLLRAMRTVGKTAEDK